MLKIPIKDVIKKIKDKTGLDEKLIERKIEEKIKEFSGFITKEGAACILANEFGIKLFKPTESNFLKIKNIIPGLKIVSFIGRVLRIYPVVEFEKNGKKGKVVSFLVGDGTGRIRVVFWDKNHISLIEKNKLNEGDIIRITNCYVKEGIMGIEVHSSASSKIDINPELNIKIPPIEELWDVPQKIKIKNITEEGSYEIRGIIVNIFENNPFFNICPECGKKIDGVCEIHGNVKPKKSMFISTIFDDGTGIIRVVFFGKQAEKILGISSEEAFELSEENKDFLYPIKSKKDEILGKEYKIEGRINKNEFSGEFEMIVKRITIPNPINEAKIILKELEYEN